MGQPLDRSKVRESLKNLYATGRFTDLRADAEPQDNGVLLVFVGRAQFFVGGVQVEGVPKSLDPRIFVDASHLRLGQAFDDQALRHAYERMRAVLAENGYYDARIIHRLDRNSDNQEVDILFSLDPGQPARLRSVKFQGQTIFPPERLARSIARWKPGDHLTSSRLERGLFRLQQFYLKQGHLQASVNLQNRSFNPQDHTESLVVQVEAGPKVRVLIEGVQVSRSKLRELLPVYKEGATDDTALERGARAAEDHFERLGYYSVSVSYQKVVHPGSQRVEITYRCVLGSRGEFAGLGFDGNRAVSIADLRGIMADPLNGEPNKLRAFSRQLLERHLTALRRLYQSRGFLEAHIAPRIDDRFEGKPGRRFVTFVIEEGTQTRVGKVTLLGVDPVTEKQVWTVLEAKSGQAYSPERAQADRERILDYFSNQGYVRPAVTLTSSPASTSHTVDLEYRVEPGREETVARIEVLGNEHVREGTIRRELTFRKGESLRQSDLLETQRRLYDLGIFSQVQIATQDPGSTERKRTVLVSVEETRRWTVGYGGGVEVQRLGSNQPQGQLKASPRLSLDVTRLAVGGRAQTLTLRGRLSNLERGGAISYLIPRLPTRPDLSLRLGGLVDRSRDVLTFTAKRQEASVSIEKRYSPATLAVGRYSFRRVQALDISNRISPAQIPLLSRPARIATVSASYVNDHRDNPTDATDGSFSLADAGVSWSRLGSEANFLRFSGQNATYHQLGSRLVFARNIRFAVESAFGGLRSVLIREGNPKGQVILTHEIPLPERFFMGGSESHRGYSINQAGPRDIRTGFPVGGNALFLNSFELRLPVAENRFGLVLFHDAGNVFSTARKMRLLKVRQNSPTDFDYATHAVGLGVRYKTPVGPVRLDMGYNLNPPQFRVEVPGGSPEVRRLSQFQFFLSIGQSF